MARVHIPGYSTLSPKKRQYVNLALLGIGFLGTALLASTLMGDSKGIHQAPRDLPKARPLAATPGSQLDPKDAWMGGAGKELATLKDRLKQRDDDVTRLQSELRSTRDQVSTEMTILRRAIGMNPDAAKQAATPMPPLLGASAVQLPVPGARSAGQPAEPPRSAAAFPSQRGIANAPQGPFPPGTPVQGNGPGAYQPGVAQEDRSMVRVSLKATQNKAEGQPQQNPNNGATGNGAAQKSVGTFLPISFTPAVLLGGVMAPTGGQSQNNPVPVLFRLTDLSKLPNGFRAHVKDCLAIGSAHGTQTEERAYVRMDMLSCVMRDGRVLEVPIMGQAFDQDGMNGLHGTLITKQDKILMNALIAGIASGIGQGISQASMTTSTSPLGTVVSTGTDTEAILRMGVGEGVSKALDRLSNYLINLAEKNMPVVEVLPGRYVDIVLTKGVHLDVELAVSVDSGSTRASRGLAPDNDRSNLMRAVGKGED